MTRFGLLNISWPDLADTEQIHENKISKGRQSARPSAQINAKEDVIGELLVPVGGRGAIKRAAAALPRSLPDDNDLNSRSGGAGLWPLISPLATIA